jgi:hypothetical protein
MRENLRKRKALAKARRRRDASEGEDLSAILGDPRREDG